jgi:predicted HTH transcriptional regulator
MLKAEKCLWGVDDKGKPVKNFTIGQESVQKWINEIKTKTQPQIIPDWEIVDCNGHETVEFSVQEYPIKPVACRGKYFKRVNNSNHLLSVAEVVNMHLQTLNTSWDAYPDNFHKLDDISLEKVEIVINMIVHRDYRSSSDSIVKIFDNKIEFYNPGRLPDDITIEKLLSGKYRSTPRNKIIAGTCKDMQLIEKYGSGIGRVCDYFKEEGLQMPEFENISEGFQVTVYGYEFFNETEVIQNNDSNNVIENVIENREQEILKLVETDNKISTKQLSEKLKVNIRTIFRDIESLKTKGFIERVGADKGGYWKVNKFHN